MIVAAEPFVVDLFGLQDRGEDTVMELELRDPHCGDKLLISVTTPVSSMNTDPH